MKIKCGLCGEEIVIADNLVEGQHILCPYCGGRSEYRKPTRIELPTGAVNHHHTAKAESGDADEVPEIPAYKRNPNLYIRRPGEGGTNGESSRRNALVDQVNARAKAEARRKLIMKLKKSASNIIALAVLVGLAVIGFKFYKSWKTGSDVNPLVDLVDRQKDAPADQVTDADVGKPVSHENVPKLEKPGGKTEGAVKERFDEVKNRFVGCKVSYWGKLPKNERPGMMEGRFYVFVPTRNGAGEYYAIESAATNAISMNRVTERSEPRKTLGNEEYTKLMTERGGFVLKDGVAYLVTPTGSKKSYQAPTRKGESFDPAEAVFGVAYSAAQKMDTAGLRFEVSFVFDEKDEPIKVADVRFGKSVPYGAFEKVAASLAREIRRKSVPQNLKTKTFKRTVVLYDGRLTSRGMGGITKVPRKYPNARGESYSDWVRLRDEALRQESEAQRCAAEARRARKEWEEKVNGPATESEIRKILLAGTVMVKRM